MTNDFSEWDILDHKFCLWDRCMITGRMGLSPNWLGFLGFQVDELIPNQEWFTALVHPEDLSQILLQWEAHLSGKEGSECFIFRLKSRQEVYLKFKSKGMIVMNSDEGKPLHLYWACERSV